VVVLHELITVKLEVVEHLLPDSRTASSYSSVFLERNVCLAAFVGYCLEIEPRGIGHIRRDLIDRESLRGLSDKRPELRGVVAMGISDCHGCDHVGFYACAKVSLNPLVLFLLAVFRSMISIELGGPKSS